MNNNLNDKTTKILKSFFSEFTFIDKVMIFGSRAKNTNHDKSDIDISIFSKSMTSIEFSKLRYKLDDLPILYQIDIIHFEKVDKELQYNIMNDGIIL